MKKKMLGLLLVAAMTIGASMTAFAAPDSTATTTVTSGDVGAGSGSVKFEGDVKTTAIQVKVTSVNTVIVNPYGMTVSYTGVSGNVESPNTLIIEPIKFENMCEIPVAVDLMGQITLPGNNYTADTYKDMATTNRVSVAGSYDAIKTATTKQVYVKATFTNAYAEHRDGKLQGEPDVLWVGTKGATANTFAKAADVVYLSGKLSASLTNPPILAATNAIGSKESKELYVVFTGGASVNPSLAWDTEKDKIELVTKYDLKYVGENKVVSRFAAAGAKATDVAGN